ncbi:MAG: putative exported protein [Pseudomonas sp.]|nr:putative exported protein [Pseudomonas sp.]
MTKISKTLLGLLTAAALATAGMAFAADPAMVKDGMMVDHKGMTLYTYDKDKGKDTSMCTDKCAENWPPMMAPADAKASGKWTMVKRADGTMQWAFDGMPLYTFKMDAKPGDMKGDGKGDVWHTAMAKH